jgi:hypothetical protein
MRNLLLAAFFFCSICAIAQEQGTISNIDSLHKMISKLEFKLQKQNEKIDSIVNLNQNHILALEFSDIDKIISQFKSPDKKIFDYIKEVLTYSIPIILAFLGAYFSIIQIKKQSRYTLIHNRANKLSEARIKWNDDLRMKISALISSSTILNYHLRKLSEIIAERNMVDKVTNITKWNQLDKKAEDYYDSKINDINNCIALTSEIQLYLDVNDVKNVNSNKYHSELEKTLSEYLDYTMEYDKLTDVKKFNAVANELITKSRRVLYDSWSKARSEGDNDIEKAYNESYFWIKLKKS